MQTYKYDGHADSFLPEGKKWKLVWNDEFDGTEQDTTKWSFRRNFWGKPFPPFTDEGVIVKDSCAELHLIRTADGEYKSPHLQTGSLTFDIPKDTNRFWPFGKLEQPKFMHRYGFYEIRCRLPKCDGWHSAFWLQSPSIGAHPDPTQCGVEVDIMENYLQYTKNEIICGSGYGGYGKNCVWHGHKHIPFKETADGWHYYSLEWSPEGYVYYFDGVEVNRETSPVSNVDQFILVSTECHGYRENGKHDPLLDQAVLPDCFVVDHVRVFDPVNE